ncbi:hypothetical protein SAMN06265365_1183 [Tistlia consotensis]|uniref:Uncharacterized protein n=1 Tax=Tistlia consotensis USBA 355 TaxID=560819 RepID=A0A1Y6C9K3_9PROT|nr:hypothetical protein [Tistlia consotensis]SMF53160.1 hypothetical protein SAMN05428998_1194 [Tistlia consotensis USBA 355]SNR85171.1 hypothetical protein SAMN06265365_1183 [Tistlia consotensis]
MSGINVFQDLVLTGPDSSRDALAAALKQEAASPWHFDAEGSASAERNAVGDKGILIFERSPADDLPAVRLVLWPQDGGYYVPNVTPVQTSKLTVSEYNAVLADFAETVAKPIARRFGFTVSTTSANQNLEDWLTPEAAIALRRFSGAANKSTGASHPMDERRWFDFIIAVHRTGKRIGSDYLARWLHEVEGWDEQSAHTLVAEFERGIALLARDVETR